MRVLLVDNLVMAEEGSSAFLDVHPHLGLLAIAAAAEADGHCVQIYDPKRDLRSGRLTHDETIYEKAALEIIAARPECVGFTTLGCSFIFAVNVAGILKRWEPDLPILLGGPHATMLHRQILERFRQFDVIVRHEADETFASVLKNLERRLFYLTPGVSWRNSSLGSRLSFTEGKPKVTNLDSLPIYSYDAYPIADLGLDLLRIEAGRGCPFMCTFCSTAGFFQRSFRLKSAERLVRELDLLHERYGFSDFKLDHDMFTVNRKKVVEFCEAVQGRGYRWRVSARVDCVDRELLSLMAKSGCVDLYFGIETGSERMQKICQKNLDLDLVRPILDAAADFGIETTASFITGYPEETPPDQNDTLDMLGTCYSRSCMVQLHILAPEPGTPMFDQVGPQIQFDGYGDRYNASLVSAEDQRLILENADIFPTYYYYPAEMPRSRYIFAVEVIDLLRRVGPVVLKYMLLAYDNKLNLFVNDLRMFAETRGFPGSPDRELLELYLTDKFGLSHHLTSLFRYALRANEVTQAPIAPRSDFTFDPGQQYQLSPSIHFLSDLHDCVYVLARLQSRRSSSQLLDNSQFKDTGLYLLRAAGQASTYSRIDDGVAEILRLFEQPRTCEEVADIVQVATGLPEIDHEFFENLVRSEVLVAAGAALALTA